MGIPPAAPPGVNLKNSLMPDSLQARDATDGASEAATGSGARQAGADAGFGDNPEDVRLQGNDGSTYTGQVKDGLRHGNGTREYPTGSYEGQWQDDLQHGRGKQIWTDGRTFEGQFVLGKFDGHGQMVWHTQKGLLCYDGEYKADAKHGHGRFTWGDGRAYEGQWERGDRHGRGRYTNANGQEKVGYWVHDKFEQWESEDAKTDDAKPDNN